MSARSFIIQLQPGIYQAILPDHRTMKPGIQYVVDPETFSKISLGARQNIIKVVTVNLDTTGTTTTASASGTFLPAQSSSGVNLMAAASGQSFLNYLTQVGTTLSSISIGGFAAQGFDPGGNAGAGAGIGTPIGSASGNAYNQTLTGPEGNRYTLVYNGTASTISGGWVTTWYDETARYITVASGTTYQVKADGLGTPYVISSNTTLPGVVGFVTDVGTRQGGFAGVTLVDIPSGNFAWVQIEGTCPRVAVPSGLAAGSTLGVNQTSGAGLAQSVSPQNASVNGTTSVVSGSALANNVFGTALTTAVSGSNGQYFSVVDIRSRRVKKPYNRVLNKN